MLLMEEICMSTVYSHLAAIYFVLGANGSLVFFRAWEILFFHLAVLIDLFFELFCPRTNGILKRVSSCMECLNLRLLDHSWALRRATPSISPTQSHITHNTCQVWCQPRYTQVPRLMFHFCFDTRP